jgi:formate-dependent nitrite reductase membrane component NrfD
MELTVTGVNAITSPNLHIWDWRVALYLFLGGLAAGSMVMSAIANLRKGKHLPPDQPCCWRVPIIIPAILAVGMFFLFLDLEAKLNMYWFYLAFNPLSPMSWGSWALILIFPVTIAYAFSVIPDEDRPILRFGFLIEFAKRMYPHMRRLAKLNFLCGIILAIYTGILLSSFLARPLWNTSILPILFLCSALSTGAALMILMARRNEVKLFFTKIDIWLIVAEIVIIALLFYGHFTSDWAHWDSIMPFFSASHEFFAYFMSIIALSIIFPLAIVLKYLEMRGEHSETITPMGKFQMNMSAILVLLGGFIIRFALVYAGQLSKLSGLS